MLLIKACYWSLDTTVRKYNPRLQCSVVDTAPCRVFASCLTLPAATIPPPSTTTEEPTTPPPTEILYGFTSDYHWDRFDRNSSKSQTVGGWSKATGLGQGPFGFGRAVAFGEGECMYDTDWMKPDPGDPSTEEDDSPVDGCMMNPANCTEGLSWSVWEQMIFGADVIGTAQILEEFLTSISVNPYYIFLLCPQLV